MTGEKKYYLGISAYFHDSAAALICDGVVVAAAAEERFTGIKHDPSFPYLAVEFCLTHADIKSSQLECVIFYESPPLKFTRVLISVLASFPRGWKYFHNAMKQWMSGYLWIKSSIALKLDIPPSLVNCTSHHLSHAYHSFINSPFERAVILTMDGVGEWACTSIADGVKSNNPPLRIQKEGTYPNSVGLLYSAFTRFLGFKPNDSECSTMALSVFGKPKYINEIWSLLKSEQEGFYSLRPGFFDFERYDDQIFKPNFTQLFGKARFLGEPFNFNCFDCDPTVLEREQYFSDVAASLQVVIEELIFSLLDCALEQFHTKNICLGGGVLNNCIAVERLLKRYGENHIYIPLDPGDGGSAIGAAFVGYYEKTKKIPSPLRSPYLGSSPNEPMLDDILDKIETLDVEEFLPDKTRKFRAKDLQVFEYSDTHELTKRSAQLLFEGNIIGWVQGRFEFGPRALGGRSILAHPASFETAQRLSYSVKSRAPYRPYGVSLTHNFARKVFGFSSQVPYVSLWMQSTFKINEKYLDRLCGVMNVDGFARPQILLQENNPLFYQLLEEFGALSGIEALLNTSFNESGSAMINSSLDALAAFIRMDLDGLVIGQKLILKPWVKVS